MTKIVFFGTPEFVIQILQNLSEKFEIVAVVTAPDAPKGRGKIITSSPVSEFASDLSIPVFKPNKLSDIERDLKNFTPDLFVVAAYGKIISETILSIPTYGSVNIHPSLLPKYRGPSPIQTALLHEDSTGISIIKMDEKMDHGPILRQWEHTLTPSDTFQNLVIEMFQDAAEKLPDIISEYIAGSLTPIPQDEDKATYCKMITKEDGHIEIDNLPEKEKLNRMIRAYHPWPTVWVNVQIQNKDLRIKFLPENMIQVEGGKPMKIKEALNGYPELTQQLQPLLQE